jgi:hypothetical protein
MASLIGNPIALAPGQEFAQSFVCDAPFPDAFLPIVFVQPLTPTFNPPGAVTQNQGLDYINYPTAYSLSVSNLWTYMSPDLQQIFYSVEVLNLSQDSVVFTFVWASL